jgi:hypothetical protein
LLQLSIDCNEGASIIPCPRCGQVLLLGFAKMGRLIVSYDGTAKRLRGPALLVCPDADCSHQEPIQLVKDSLDAIAFDSHGASHIFKSRQAYWHRSIAEMDELIKQYQQAYRQTKNPKLPCLIRLWRQQFDYTCSTVTHSVHQAHRKKEQIHLVGPNLDEKGYIKAIREDGVLLQRSQTKEEIFCEAGQLRSAYVYRAVVGWTDEEQQMPGGAKSYGDLRTIHSPSCFAVLEGHTFVLERATFYGRVRLATTDPALAKAYGFVESDPGHWVGEMPAPLVQRAYRRIQLCYVNGYRMRISAETTNPEVFQVETNRHHIAEALGMPRSSMLVFTRRGNRRTRHRFFHRNEIDRIEELQVPYKLSMPRERTHRKR